MATKTRTTSIPYPATPPNSGWFGYTAATPAGPFVGIGLGSTFGSGSHTTRTETMVSETGKDGRFRPCLHDETYRAVSPQDDVIFDLRPFGLANVLKLDKYTALRSVETKAVTAPSTSVSSNDWKTLDTTALSMMMPGTEGNLSLINFLIELKDFRRVSQAFINRKAVLQTLILGSEARSGSLAKEFGKRPLRSLSSSYLNYTFNWRSLISDVLKIYKSLVRTNARLHDLWARQGVQQTRHARIPISGSFPVTWSNYTGSTFYFGYSGTGVAQCRFSSRNRWVEPPVYHATMRYSYRCPGILGAMNKVRGWLDAFGIRLDLPGAASIIWNAVPFTFIIDWIFDVSKFLRSYSESNLGLQVTVEDFCSSVSYGSLAEGVVHGTKSGTSLITDRVTLVQVFRRFYERRTGLPNLRSALSATGLSNQQYVLSTALVLARGKR